MVDSDASMVSVTSTSATFPNPAGAIRLLTRAEINTTAWDACVGASAECIVYGYSWYLDAVLPKPEWQWVGLVIDSPSDGYEAVMPLPLRRKSVAGICYAWVIHQPFFCQFLTVFRRTGSINPTLFLEVAYEHFRYASSFHCQIKLAAFTGSLTKQVLSTHVLDLSVGYTSIYEHYTSDRRRNLRLAQALDWAIVDSTDSLPLLTLFRDNHAEGIPGGVNRQAYRILEKLIGELTKRGLASLQYAVSNGQIEAGALFVREGNRLIYLFNAASEIGRRGNARTVLINQQIQHYAGQPLLLDFESPEKPSVRLFYKSFGAVEAPFWALCWNRLSTIERLAVGLKNKIARR
ncbi:GNAT family N-acetyltransferase [Spirosoma fluminis]